MLSSIVHVVVLNVVNFRNFRRQNRILRSKHTEGSKTMSCKSIGWVSQVSMAAVLAGGFRSRFFRAACKRCRNRSDSSFVPGSKSKCKRSRLHTSIASFLVMHRPFPLNFAAHPPNKHATLLDLNEPNGNSRFVETMRRTWSPSASNTQVNLHTILFTCCSRIERCCKLRQGMASCRWFARK